MNVRFCPTCRSLILADFRFCPYCGSAVSKGPELSDALELPFDKLEGAAPAGQQGPRPPDPEPRPAQFALGAGKAEAPASAKPNVFAKVEESLDRLESDMDMILEELEKEGRSTRGG